MVVTQESESCMNVIGHHHPGVLHTSLTLEKAQCITNNPGRIGLSQDTASIPEVQPSVDDGGELAMKNCLRFRRPRPGMGSQPMISLKPPLVQLRLRHGVGHSKCNEVRRSRLFPVGKHRCVLLDLSTRVEELEIVFNRVHDQGVTPSRRQIKRRDGWKPSLLAVMH